MYFAKLINVQINANEDFHTVSQAKQAQRLNSVLDWSNQLKIHFAQTDDEVKKYLCEDFLDSTKILLHGFELEDIILNLRVEEILSGEAYWLDTFLYKTHNETLNADDILK